MMDIDRLETHDRLLDFTSKGQSIEGYCQKMTEERPFGDHSFYIFGHKRILPIDKRYKLFLSGKYKNLEHVPTHEIVWQPRLTKPKSQTNSMLFKVTPGSPDIMVFWIIPDRELWDQYKKGQLTHDPVVFDSIQAFQHDRKRLDKKEESDLSDEKIDAIYRELAKDGKRKQFKQKTLEASQKISV